MENKSAGGRIRNKERSKKRFLEAVGKILKTKGHTALKINDIAATAGVDKKMIYTYFDGMDGLMDEYIQSQNAWEEITATKMSEINPKIDKGGIAFIEELLISQFENMHDNREMQKMILWRLSEPRKSLIQLTSTQEENREYFFKLMVDSHFREYAQKFRSIIAVMLSGLYYLNMYASVNGSIFCGIDLNCPADREKIKKAISFLLEKSYQKLSYSE
ncbi:TetR/AcrR family transcriptional regulator [Chryseobacterium sp. JK1]|uniref:TetR/AcrR family transcriptional regulator n=1 Tax=Chryseobacterium sp. JK1 TaxID=874294 RepID=UPI003D69A112